MWGRFSLGDSNPRVGPPTSVHDRAWPRPPEGGQLRRGSTPGRGSQDRGPSPPPCPPGSEPAPCRKEALDFHGKAPPLYPYRCSLCDITVMSEKVWLQHINATPHADRQLQLLQRFPHWDCRLQPGSSATPLGTGNGPAPSFRAKGQSEHREEEGAPERPSETTNQNSTLPTKTKKKAVSRSSVVCVKFPPQAVDEVFLRRLAERFGPVTKVQMFPSLAFMELGSAQQAQDLVRFHQKEPATVQGQQMEFRVSHTFSFPQSSRVVSFSPAPPAEGELMALVRGFGRPLYTLVLPTAVLVEMEEAADAQKLLDRFSSSGLKVNGEVVSVTFSREFRSLMRVAGALKCQEEDGGTCSREQGSRSQEASAAPPAEEAAPEEDSELSADSDIEGMEVIAANLEDDDDDDDLENQDEEEPQEVDPPSDWRKPCTPPVGERGAAQPEEETLKRRASSQNPEEPQEKRSSHMAELELSHQRGVTATPESLKDPQSQQAEPAGGAVEQQNAAQPVGTEFVRPVVGYFCHLCQVIYANEDEAKGQHCSSPAHYRKYQEKTGRDPWR